MSCFVCHETHISILAGYAVAHREQIGFRYDPQTGEDYSPQDIGAILYAENLRSYHARYPRESAEDLPFRLDDKAARAARKICAVQIIKAAQSFDYQACETEDFKTSLAAKITAAIVAHAIHNLPGYESAAWAIDSLASLGAAR